MSSNFEKTFITTNSNGKNVIGSGSAKPRPTTPSFIVSTIRTPPTSISTRVWNIEPISRPIEPPRPIEPIRPIKPLSYSEMATTTTTPSLNRPARTIFYSTPKPKVNPADLVWDATDCEEVTVSADPEHDRQAKIVAMRTNPLKRINDMFTSFQLSERWVQKPPSSDIDICTVYDPNSYGVHGQTAAQDTSPPFVIGFDYSTKYDEWEHDKNRGFYHIPYAIGATPCPPNSCFRNFQIQIRTKLWLHKSDCECNSYKKRKCEDCAQVHKKVYKKQKSTTPCCSDCEELQSQTCPACIADRSKILPANNVYAHSCRVENVVKYFFDKMKTQFDPIDCNVDKKSCDRIFKHSKDDKVQKIESSTTIKKQMITTIVSVKFYNPQLCKNLVDLYSPLYVLSHNSTDLEDRQAEIKKSPERIWEKQVMYCRILPSDCSY